MYAPPVFYFFVQLPGVEDLAAAKRAVAKGVAGRVLASGTGTATDPTAAWFEVKTSLDSVKTIRESLAAVHLTPTKVESIERGWGSTMAKQLDLLGRLT
jgi:hypothetical protein